MALIQYFYANRTPIAMVTMRRLQEIDLSDRESAADIVSDYEVSLDTKVVGRVRHRYGDGPFVLGEKANAVVITWMNQHGIDPLSEDWRE